MLIPQGMDHGWPKSAQQYENDELSDVSPSVSLSHLEASISLLSISIRGRTD